MVIVSLKTEAVGEPADRICRVGLSDGSLFSFRNCYLPPEVISACIEPYSGEASNTSLTNNDISNREKADGSKITAFEEEAFRHASACLRAEKAALRLIARAEQCEAGLRRKLEKRGHEAACVNAVIERLCSLQLLDDARFARLWLESRIRLPRSPRRLLIALCSRGIPRDDAESAIKNVLDDDTEYALLQRFARKLSRKKKHDEDDSRSLKYLLKNEGFSREAIQRYLEAE